MDDDVDEQCVNVEQVDDNARAQNDAQDTRYGLQLSKA